MPEVLENESWTVNRNELTITIKKIKQNKIIHSSHENKIQWKQVLQQHGQKITAAHAKFLFGG